MSARDYGGPMRATAGTQRSSVEAVVVGVLGATLGGAFGWWLHPWVAVAMAVVAGLNGAVSGWRRVYAWRTRWGVVAFVADSTWATLPVAAGLLAQACALGTRSAGFDESLSRRQNRHVYRGGVCLQRGFALTLGNVISSAGDVSRARRRKLITDHEAVHVWQARAFGPLYLVLYLVWSLGGAVLGWVVWLLRRRREPLGKVVESCAYYLNPFEWWAYSRDDLWPPPGLLPGLGWRRAAARPLSAVRATRATRATRARSVDPLG